MTLNDLERLEYIASDSLRKARSNPQNNWLYAPDVTKNYVAAKLHYFI